MYSRLVLTIFAFIFSVTFAFNVELEQHWQQWKQTYNKRYSHKQELVRRATWESNLKIVQEHNLKADLGVYTYWLGMNQFADLTLSEFSKLSSGKKEAVKQSKNSNVKTFTYNPNLRLPDTVDWREKGYVTPVRQQEECSSDWAITATGALEGLHFNATGKLIPLSIQQLIDCSDSQGNQGCVNGTAIQAFQYIKQVGLEAETSYPYENIDYKCRANASLIVANCTGFTQVTSKDENALQQAVAASGPVAVTIDSNHQSFQLYKSGVYHEIFCSEKTLDRSMLVVGYGTDTGKDYWLVKNSWGTTWGEQGYIRMTRNKKNQCGIATDASYPTA